MLPVAKLATSNLGINSVEVIVTDGAPDSTAFDLQTTFTWCPAVDKSQIYNHSRSVQVVEIQSPRLFIKVTYSLADTVSHFLSRLRIKAEAELSNQCVNKNNQR